MAESDMHALGLAREAVASLPAPESHGPVLREPRDPALDPDDLYGIVSADPRKRGPQQKIVLRTSSATDSRLGRTASQRGSRRGSKTLPPPATSEATATLRPFSFSRYATSFAFFLGRHLLSSTPS